MPKINPQQHAYIYTTLKANPGINLNRLARLTGIEYHALQSNLPGMEKTGYLLSEDSHNHLYPFISPGEDPYSVILP